MTSAGWGWGSERDAVGLPVKFHWSVSELTFKTKSRRVEGRCAVGKHLPRKPPPTPHVTRSEIGKKKKIPVLILYNGSLFSRIGWRASGEIRFVFPPGVRVLRDGCVRRATRSGRVVGSYPSDAPDPASYIYFISNAISPELVGIEARTRFTMIIIIIIIIITWKCRVNWWPR